MRRGILGSIAAVAAGAGAAWGQQMPAAPIGDPPRPAASAPSQGVVPVNGPLLPPGLTGPIQQPPAIMPPLAIGPASDPQGLGPVGGFGPPPAPLYPNPGPYGAPLFQPGPSSDSSGYGAAPHWWTSLDYMLLFSRSQPARYPLLTTSSPTADGVIGQPSTIILAGGKDYSYNPFNGARLTIGFFGDADRRFGFEGSGFVTEKRSDIIDITSSPTGIPTLARPFLDSTSPTTQTSLVIANPGFANGRVVVDTNSQLYTAEANGVLNLYRSEPGGKSVCSIDILAGYRYLQLHEDLSVESSTTLNLASTTTPIFAIGTGGVITQVGTTTTQGSTTAAGLTVKTPGIIAVLDDFQTTNRFNGGQVAVRGEYRYGMFTFNATAKVGIGDMHEELDIRGGTAILNITNGQMGTAYGGLLANSSNIGHYTHDEFSVIPELNLNVGIAVTKSLSAFIGYNYLYINKVARPGNEINPVVNTGVVPFSSNYGATNRPGVTQNLFMQDSYWLMGLNFGMVLKY